MTEQITRYFGPIDETLEKLYKANQLKNPSKLPLDYERQFFLMPNGDFLFMNECHTKTIGRYLTKKEYLPNGAEKPCNFNQHPFFYTDLNIIRVQYYPKDNNRLELVIVKPINQAQLKTIQGVIEDIPDIWLRYDVVNHAQPFSVSGQGYREMIKDLRKKNYLPKE